jgi:ABC-type Zn uptake system ZnuABC Zn-binding protein ZnuA
MTRRPLAFLLAWLAAASSAAAEPPLRVMATIQPIAMLVREVGADRITVSALVPPGASPHTFEPRPSDLAALAGAALVVEVGGGLDGWVRPLLGAATPAPQRLTLIERPDVLTPPLPVAHEHERGRDPHVWLDPLRVRDELLPTLAWGLGSIDPAGRADYAAAAGGARTRLTALDTEIRALLADRGRRFVAFHAAWRHFAARYGLEEVAVVEEAPGEEPTPRELAELVERARAARVAAILIEPQLSPRIAQSLAAELGVETVLVDPNGDPSDPERDTYPELMRWNARAFARALGPAR